MTLKEQRQRDPYWNTRPRPRMFPWSKHVKPLNPGERRKVKVKLGDGEFTCTVYEETDAENNQLSYSKEGFKCRRCFIIGDLAITGTGNGTIWDAMWLSGIPTRGTPHPYINSTTWAAYFASPPPAALPAGLEFAADVITVTPIDSQNMKVTVEYAMLNGATQEPTTENDTNPALLQVASSVQNIHTNIDYFGSKLVATYGPDVPLYDVYDSQGNGPLVAPASMCTAAKQVPSTIFRFLRRQTEAYPPDVIQCCINSAAWTILGHEYAPHELLCTRVENETEDGGFSYVVTYEFQARKSLAANGNDPAIPGWDVGMFYSIQDGYAVASGAGAAGQRKFSTGQIPEDADANVFQIYDEADFTALNLTPT
jgi:hypothetical protein